MKTWILSLAILAILTIGIASAQTMVAGKIYDSSYSNVIEGAMVTVICASSALNTVSLSDGTYAVKFGDSECTLGNSVNVAASKGTLIGSGSGTMALCTGKDCPEEYFVVINAAMKEQGTTKPSGGSSSSSSSGGNIGSSAGKVYICGNGKCDSGENANTCPKDCAVINNAKQSNATVTKPEEVTDTEIIALNSDVKQKSKITGAFVAFGNAINLPLSVSILSFLIILFIGHKIIQIRKKGKKRALFGY